MVLQTLSSDKYHFIMSAMEQEQTIVITFHACKKLHMYGGNNVWQSQWGTDGRNTSSILVLSSLTDDGKDGHNQDHGAHHPTNQNPHNWSCNLTSFTQVTCIESGLSRGTPVKKNGEKQRKQTVTYKDCHLIATKLFPL